MAIKEHDTDPSTPAARSPRVGAPAPSMPITPAKILAVSPVGMPDAAVRTKSRVSTDPGVAPPPAGRPRGGHDADTDPDPRAPVAVAAAVAARKPIAPPTSGTNDSIDTLLDGISGPQPEKTKKTPQSRGEAAASYQVEHKVLPGQPTPPPQPSVIVERPKQPPTVRIERAKIAAAKAEWDAAHGIPSGSITPVPRAGESTVVTPRKQGPRIVVALFAAVLVVFAIFMVMRMWAVGVKREAMTTDPTASALIYPSARPKPALVATTVATAALVATANATTPAATSTPTPTPTATSTSTPTATATAAPTSTSKPAATGANGGSTGDGEFKHDFKH